LLKQGKSLPQVSKNLGIRREILSDWKQQFQSYGEEVFIGTGALFPRMNIRKN